MMKVIWLLFSLLSFTAWADPPADNQCRSSYGLVSIGTTYLKKDYAQNPPTELGEKSLYGVGFSIKLGDRYFLVTNSHLTHGDKQGVVSEIAQSNNLSANIKFHTTVNSTDGSLMQVTPEILGRLSFADFGDLEIIEIAANSFSGTFGEPLFVDNGVPNVGEIPFVLSATARAALQINAGATLLSNTLISSLTWGLSFLRLVPSGCFAAIGDDNYVLLNPWIRRQIFSISLLDDMYDSRQSPTMPMTAATSPMASGGEIYTRLHAVGGYSGSPMFRKIGDNYALAGIGKRYEYFFNNGYFAQPHLLSVLLRQYLQGVRGVLPALNDRHIRVKYLMHHDSLEREYNHRGRISRTFLPENGGSLEAPGGSGEGPGGSGEGPGGSGEGPGGGDFVGTEERMQRMLRTLPGVVWRGQPVLGFRYRGPTQDILNLGLGSLAIEYNFHTAIRDSEIEVIPLGSSVIRLFTERIGIGHHAQSDQFYSYGLHPNPTEYVRHDLTLEPIPTEPSRRQLRFHIHGIGARLQDRLSFVVRENGAVIDAENNSVADSFRHMVQLPSQNSRYFVDFTGFFFDHPMTFGENMLPVESDIPGCRSRRQVFIRLREVDSPIETRLRWQCEDRPPVN